MNIKDLDKLENEIIDQLIDKARKDFYVYVKLMAQVVLPERFVDGEHLRVVCKELQEVAESVEDKTKTPKRLQIMMAPGSMKSKIASNLFPSWCLGRNPNWCFLAIGSDFEFAVDNFGRPTKDIIESEQYKAIFPGVTLKKDVQSAGRWDTTRKGRFVARGAGQNIAGRRAHIAIVDDAITEQTMDAERIKINNWYRKGLRTRLLPRGAEIIINTRWFLEDLSGFMLKVDGEEGQKLLPRQTRPWRVIRIPAILTLEASTMLRKHLPVTDTRFAVGTSFWPEFWPTEVLLEKKATMPIHEWSALYMQEPISEDGGIIKRTDWQYWEKPEPPKCKYVIVSVDTALSQKEYANYSAYTVWGIFVNLVSLQDNSQIAQDSMILLSAGKGKWDFAELCNKCQDLDRRYTPEFFIVEDTSAGILLIPELQKRSLPVVPFKPEKDKTFRLQATTPYFQAGRVFVPRGKTWAEEVIAEVCNFQPRLRNQDDDFTDTVSQAVVWMRDHFKIDNDGFSNKWDEEVYTQRSKTYWSSVMEKHKLL